MYKLWSSNQRGECAKLESTEKNKLTSIIPTVHFCNVDAGGGGGE